MTLDDAAIVLHFFRMNFKPNKKWDSYTSMKYVTNANFRKWVCTIDIYFIFSVIFYISNLNLFQRFYITHFFQFEFPALFEFMTAQSFQNSLPQNGFKGIFWAHILGSHFFEMCYVIVIRILRAHCPSVGFVTTLSPSITSLYISVDIWKTLSLPLVCQRSLWMPPHLTNKF